MKKKNKRKLTTLKEGSRSRSSYVSSSSPHTPPSPRYDYSAAETRTAIFGVQSETQLSHYGKQECSPTRQTPRTRPCPRHMQIPKRLFSRALIIFNKNLQSAFCKRHLFYSKRGMLVNISGWWDTQNHIFAPIL